MIGTYDDLSFTCISFELTIVVTSSSKEEKLSDDFQANSVGACQQACAVEDEFLCRSFVYTGPTNGQSYNCKLFHMDHWTLPDGIQAFTVQTAALIEDPSRIGTYYENKCASKSIYFSSGFLFKCMNNHFFVKYRTVISFN